MHVGVRPHGTVLLGPPPGGQFFLQSLSALFHYVSPFLICGRHHFLIKGWALFVPIFVGAQMSETPLLLCSSENAEHRIRSYLRFQERLDLGHLRAVRMRTSAAEEAFMGFLGRSVEKRGVFTGCSPLSMRIYAYVHTVAVGRPFTPDS